ncbi:TRM11 family SAM-dependent methyltransferase [Halovivax gelatinilyticus]|uniref:TRM11 family SAM-dependent methyltransferase n=1 Tax=Halovivax gelatinilyticus TaxID=2961597 RepID=UPI0020CA7E9E|nr:DNA methyltransferase [Halovivax gelatinilyticus]
MESVISVPARPDEPLPEWADGTDPRSAPEVVERFLSRYSDPGDVVLDPFAGFGTTLVVAESMGREAWGIEFERERVEYVKSRIDHPGRVRRADARTLTDLDLPDVDCVFTSPPYTLESATDDPFQNYDGESAYDDYLDGVGRVASELSAVLADDGTLVMQVSNLIHDGHVTTLAWDVADACGEYLHLDREVVLAWEDGPKYGYDHGYALVFSTGE